MFDIIHKAHPHQVPRNLSLRTTGWCICDSFYMMHVACSAMQKLNTAPQSFLCNFEKCYTAACGTAHAS